MCCTKGVVSRIDSMNYNASEFNPVRCSLASPRLASPRLASPRLAFLPDL